MKRLVLIFCVLFAALSASAIADSNTMMSSAMTPTIAMPDSLKWTPLKGFQGAWVAVIYGTPDKPGSGEYAERLKMNDGVKFPVHYHLQTEQVTVLSGTIMVGIGSKFDASKMTSFGPGAFAAIPAHLNHYAQAKGETIIEIHGNAPDSLVIVK